jgi:membrane protein YdbS with pleckstrin-like domain
MFCEKCGAKLEDDALFCTKCGAKVGEANSVGQEKVDDNEVKLKVKPIFKFWYMMFPTVITFLICILMVVVPSSMAGPEVALGMFVVLFVIFALIVGIIVFFKSKQYKHLTYDFYSTKVIFEDSFLNLAQKEVKYKYIREVTMRQSFVQRWFNIGNIILYTNAETGIGNGIQIINVENVHDIYKQIKEIVNV